MHKALVLWSNFSDTWGIDFEELQQVYQHTAGCAGLVHAVRGPVLTTEWDTYAVSLSPLGLQRIDAVPCNKKEAALAAHGLLHDLVALHKVRRSLP